MPDPTTRLDVTDLPSERTNLPGAEPLEGSGFENEVADDDGEERQ